MIAIWPNTFIVGAAKAGTTSLYSYLRQHPAVFMSSFKEPHYFSNVRPRNEQKHIIPVVSTEREYLKLFQGARNETIIGEASPSYLWDEFAARRIKEKISDARIVVILRDPIDRAYSHYLMDVREGIQYLPFAEALLEDYRKKEKGWGISHLYIELGMYYEQVRRYLDVFGERNVCVLIFETLKHDPVGLLKQVIEFLDLNRDSLSDINVNDIHNRYAAPRGHIAKKIMGNKIIRNTMRIFVPHTLRRFCRNHLLLREDDKPSMTKEAIRFLQDIYESDVRCLESLLGIELSALKKVWI